MAHGGKRPNSGRKSKAEELGLAQLFSEALPNETRKSIVSRLSEIAQGDDAKAAVSAASLLFGYLYGKPTEKHEHGGKDGGPIVLNVVYKSK